MENVDYHAQVHVMNFKQFERIEYFHSGKSKKKLSLNDAGHRFNLKHTDAMIDNLLESLSDHDVIVQDISENWSCLYHMNLNLFIGQFNKQLYTLL